MSAPKNDYVKVVYNEKDRPLTKYPKQLTGYLFERYKIASGSKLLDVGCGRGEFLKGFIEYGVLGYAVDQSSISKKYCPEAELRISDIENEGIPFPDNFFDTVYSKSVIEHFHYPERFVKEIYRVLKPGGLVITLCPSWEYNNKIYFEDYTHRTPFMMTSLKDIYTIHNFQDVKVEFFRQLPSTWGRFGIMSILFSKIVSLLIPPNLKKYSKYVRFSKEIMLLASAKKPCN